jgi:hypothetical protein
VGPSLANFGVPSPATLPRIAIYDGSGKPNGPYSTVSYDWTALFQQAGAFPLAGGERLGLMSGMDYFRPGSYTIHVNDDAGLGGTVLVEVYELP